MGILEIRTTETLTNPNVILNVLRSGENGKLVLQNVDGHTFQFDHQTYYINILRKWSRICISYNFERNEAQAAINGVVSQLVKDPVTSPNNNNTWDANIITDAAPNSQMVVMIGRYGFDKNPVIGYYANVNAWDRTMTSEELKERTQCNKPVVDQGNVINDSTPWTLTGTLVKKIFVSINDTKCSKQNEKVNAFLPIPQLTKEEAKDLCNKFGGNVSIGGKFETLMDFDVYYEGLYANQKYLDQCGFYDNGRLKTWLPYHQSSDETILVHELTKEPLMSNSDEKFYAAWYGGPKSNVINTKCVAAYFGPRESVPKYKNLEESDCMNKKCTACEIQNSFEDTSVLKLNGLCKYSFFDTTYQIQYDPENIIKYVGIEKSIISFDFAENIWIIRDVSNPFVNAVSDAPFRSLAIGNHLWNITNDTECSKEVYSKYLSLTSCSDDQFTCNDGLCININERYVELILNILIE